MTLFVSMFREHVVVLRHRCTIVTPTPMSNSGNYEKTGHYLSARGSLGSFWLTVNMAFVSKNFDGNEFMCQMFLVALKTK